MTACDADKQTRHVPSLWRVVDGAKRAHSADGGKTTRTHWNSDDSICSISCTRICPSRLVPG